MSLTKQKFGLTTFQLKLIALICMTIDHLGAYTYNIPIFTSCNLLLRTIGRIAAPLFLFAVVQGAIHTRSKWKYLLRLYLAGVCVGIFDSTVYFLWGEAIGLPAFGNIFVTFFFVVLYILLAEHLLDGLKTKNRKTVLLSLLGFAASLAPYFILKLASLVLADSFVAVILARIFPVIISVQYGIPFVVLGVCMYFAKTKGRQCLVYFVFCILCLVYVFFLRRLLPGFFRALVGSAYGKTQCYMILALPFMLLYNGKKGKSGKWLFYGYYPVHRYIIALTDILLG